MRISVMIALLVGGLCAAGCSDPKPSKTPDRVEDVDDVAARPAKAEKPTREASDRDTDANDATASVDDRIAKMCDLPEPRFDFNSANLGPSAQKVIEAIAKCFIDGAGKGKDLAIVGHADPRGDEDTNFALGQRRAGAVAAFLKKAGLGEDRVSTSSRGELDAIGTDESGWAKDRRAEIRLAQ